MKILFFNYEYPPLGGGAGNASFYILQEYAKIPELEVDFITSSVDDAYHLEKIGERIFVHRLPIGKNNSNIHFQSQKDLLKYTIEAWKFAKKLVREKEYDLTHSFFTVPCGYLSLKLKRKYQIPYIVSLRGSDVPGYSERFTFLYSFITPTIKKIWKNAQFVIANSQGLKELALKSDPQKEIGVIPNGVRIDEFFPDSSKRNPGVFRILYAGRITPRKGVRFLIQAFAKLAEKYSQAHLVIVGEGNEKESLENLVRSLNLQSRVTFAGLVPHEQLQEYYAKSNVVVLPSLNEGMSNMLLEALSAGLPIVATDTGGTKELVFDGENGFIIKMQSDKDIEEKLAILMDDENLAKKMGEKSRSLAEKMSWENVARAYENVYAETRNLRIIKEEKI